MNFLSVILASIITACNVGAICNSPITLHCTRVVVMSPASPGHEAGSQYIQYKWVAPNNVDCAYMVQHQGLWVAKVVSDQPLYVVRDRADAETHVEQFCQSDSPIWENR